jgi:hypothetical protein
MSLKLHNGRFVITDSDVSFNEKSMPINSLVNRINVGTNGKYATLKEAVDWFNASATANTEILLDGGNHNIADTITVNNSSYNLAIRGLGFKQTYLNAATGLTNKPMFDVKTNCTFNRLVGVGSTLGSYGSAAGENFITLSGSGGHFIYFHDVSCDTFKIGLADLSGDDVLGVDFILDTCGKGVEINHTGTASIDLERANLVDCSIGIDLVKATNHSFIFRDLIFFNPALGIGIKYDGSNYTYGTQFSQIVGCSYNNVGTFLSGFDFTRRDGRDKDIIIINNIGIENKNPHCKINVVDNTTATTVTTAGTYYKVGDVFSKTRIIFNNAATAGTWTITVDDQTTAAIQWNASAANIKSAIEALSNVTTVTVTQITASKEWTVQFETATEGWVNQTVDISGLSTTTSAEVIKSFYTCKATLDQNQIKYQPSNTIDCVTIICGNLQVNQVNRSVTIGVKKNNTGQIISPMTVRCGSANQPYPFSLVAYLDEVIKDDYFELFVTSSTNGDQVIVQDLTWYFESR